MLVLTFTNSGTITGGTATDAFGHVYSADITISGVSYAVSGDVGDKLGATANLGNIDVATGYNAPPTFTPTEPHRRSPMTVWSAVAWLVPPVVRRMPTSRPTR